ncbi:MAG: hypothetical protein KJP18_08895 [Gemmatimonadetes bacterium]|nr:hypothetical protein [Gemmatimonadota bacterium]NNK61786.1 hypothetical protein [Gemmatimonadota bacterium]
MNKRVVLCAAVGLLSLVGRPAPAAAQVRFAPTLSWGNDADIAVGGRLLVNLGRLISDEGARGRLDLVVPVEWYFDCSDCTYIEVTPGLILPLTIRDVGPYLGAGLNIARISLDAEGRDASDVEVGLGLSGGILFPVGQFSGFAEARATLGGAEQTVVTVGLQLGGTRNRNR